MAEHELIDRLTALRERLEGEDADCVVRAITLLLALRARLSRVEGELDGVLAMVERIERRTVDTPVTAIVEEAAR